MSNLFLLYNIDNIKQDSLNKKEKKTALISLQTEALESNIITIIEYFVKQGKYKCH